MGFYRYRNYVVFAATSLFMMLGCAMLLDAIHALGQGEEAWLAFLARMARPYYLATSTRGAALHLVLRVPLRLGGPQDRRRAGSGRSPGRRCRCS